MTDKQSDAQAGDVLREDVRNAVERGLEVQESVRQIALKALTSGKFDTEAMRKVANEAAEGMRLGAARHGTGTREVLEKAFTGLNEAFSGAAQAASLAAKELQGAAARAFSEGELRQAMDEFKSLQGLTADAMRRAAGGGRDAATDIMRTLAEHATRSGPVVGRQMQASIGEMNASLAKIAQAQMKDALTLGMNAATLFARTASGVLSGIADGIEARRAQEKRKREDKAPPQS